MCGFLYFLADVRGAEQLLYLAQGLLSFPMYCLTLVHWFIRYILEKKKKSKVSNKGNMLVHQIVMAPANNQTAACVSCGHAGS